jgi:NADP-reducing hydrogenase subunit HndC
MNEKLRYKKHLFICAGKSCSAKSDPDAAKKFFKEKIKEHGLKDKVRACTSSCLDYCDESPNIAIYPEATLLSHVEEKDWKKIFESILSELDQKR